MKRFASHFVVGVLAFGVGSVAAVGDRNGSPDGDAEVSGPLSEVPGLLSEVPGPLPEVPLDPAVTGIGGVFFKSADPIALRSWYQTHLGIDSEEWGGFVFQWDVQGKTDETGYTVWTPFPEASDYFAPGEQSFMINYRVRDLEGLVAGLRDAGAEIAGEIEQYPNGAFAWVLDPDGRKIELWEPIASKDDPYLDPGA